VLLAEIKGITWERAPSRPFARGLAVLKLEYDFLVIATGMRPSLISVMTSSRGSRPGSRASTTLRRSEPRS